MASLSPQRTRKSHPPSQVPAHPVPPRETSRSPSYRERPRTIKAQSMPLAPSVVQMFNQPQPTPQGQQASPTISNPAHPSRRSPPPASQPIRPSPQQSSSSQTTNVNTVHHPDSSPDHRLTPPYASNIPQALPHTQSQPAVNPQTTHFPRPSRVQQPAFLSSFQEMDQNWQMTAELLAEIEEADQQKSRSLGQNQPNNPSHPANYGHVDSDGQLRDAALDRIKGSERASPKDNEGSQQRRQREQAARESPKTRDRHPQQQVQQMSASPSSFNQPPPQSRTPELHISPQYHSPLSSPGEHTAGYNQYKRDSPPVSRRAGNQVPDSRSQPSASSQTPPQAVQARSPDRSLPVQEEAEDDVRIPSVGSNRNGEDWEHAEPEDGDERLQAVSPAPSSDINPVGPRYDVSRMHGGRDSRTGHRNDDNLVKQDQLRPPSDEDAFTPRSPTADLPDSHSRHISQDGSKTVRAKHRNGVTDQLGLQSFDPAIFTQGTNGVTMGSHGTDPPKYGDQRRPQRSQTDYHDVRPEQNGQSYGGQLHPDDLQSLLDHPASAYIHAFLQSPRPNAPIPPTPHSQTAAPSPSPFISGMYSDPGSKDLPPFSPVAPVGSPYPYPFTHVRRNQSFSSQPNRPHPPSNYDPNHPSVIQEQLVKQWQVYAQNNHGYISDSTLSPSSTPYPGGMFNPWAYWHTKRTLGNKIQDPRSLQSSPSHEPVSLAPAPMIGLKKKDRSSNLRKQGSMRKPPPRVESTQPRETSPELSSSGEETAGEEHYAVPEEGNWVNQTVPTDDSGDWIDEDDDPDEDDLLELEYHPTYVSNVEKRRRRWETRWEALVQAFQALDRQTDATLVLLAAPSHSSKLYSITSRSVRRQPTWRNSPAMANLRASFRQIATQRRNSRIQKPTLVDRLLMPSTSSVDGSDVSNESREEDLKRALGAALGSLGALGGIYEQREARWKEEMRRISEERERVELLLKQALGEQHGLPSNF